MRLGRTITTAIAAVTMLAIGAGSSGAHTLKAARAANLNKAVTRAVCDEIVDDARLGTCVGWSSGPCPRLSEHRIRCRLSHTFELEDGSQVRCRQTQEWYIPSKGTKLNVRSVPGSVHCGQIRGPEPPVVTP